MKRSSFVLFLLAVLGVMFLSMGEVTTYGSYESNRAEINRGLNLADDLADVTFTNLSSVVPESLVVVAGTPMSPTNLIAKYTNNFNYTGGSLIVGGTDSLYLNITGAVSMKSAINNVTVSAYFCRNGVVDSTSIIDRKISTGADVGAVPANAMFLVAPGDTLDYKVDSDTNTTIYLTRMNFTIHEMSRKE